MPRNPNQPPSSPNVKKQNIVPIREPGSLQEKPVVPTQEVPGFKGCRVYLTMERKPPNDPKSDKHNEDNVLTDPTTGLMGVMDGLGGMGNGNLASRAVERLLPQAYAEALANNETTDIESLADRIAKSQKQKLTGLGDPDAIAERLDEMKNKLVKADPAIAQKAWALIQGLQAINEPVKQTKGMTTACVGVVHETPKGGRYAIVANVGDSGAFIRRKDGTVERLTSEDSVFDNLVRHGVKVDGMDLKEYLDTLRDKRTGNIPLNKIVKIPVTPESCRVFGYSEKNCDELIKKGSKSFDQEYGELKVWVQGAIGDATPPIPSLEIVKLEPGDELIFCTDGIIDKYENAMTGEIDTDELSMDLELASDPLDRLDTLRVISAQRKVHFKYVDDIAAVSAVIE